MSTEFNNTLCGVQNEIVSADPVACFEGSAITELVISF